jgi:hypothetical protein
MFNIIAIIRRSPGKSLLIRTLIEHYLSKEEAELFSIWAFGEDFKEGNINLDAHIRWNKLHSHLLTLSEMAAQKMSSLLRYKFRKSTHEHPHRCNGNT